MPAVDESFDEAMCQYLSWIVLANKSSGEYSDHVSAFLKELGLLIDDWFES